MNQNPITETEQVKVNIQNIKDELTYLLLHREVLIRMIDERTKIFESKIVTPKITNNLSKIGSDDLAVDLVPVKNATKEQILARYEWYHYSLELADANVAIEAKTNLLKEYQDHLKQYFNKQATKITDEMIFDKYHHAQSLVNLNQEEQKTLKGIGDEMMKRLNSGKDARLELYESLQNLILQHGQ